MSGGGSTFFPSLPPLPFLVLVSWLGSGLGLDLVLNERHEGLTFGCVGDVPFLEVRRGRFRVFEVIPVHLSLLPLVESYTC